MLGRISSLQGCDQSLLWSNHHHSKPTIFLWSPGTTNICQQPWRNADDRTWKQKLTTCRVPPTLTSACNGPFKRKSAASWLTILPIEEHGFTQHRRTFRVATSLRYSWPPAHIPVSCAYESFLSIQHALSYPKCCYHLIRHNAIRDLTV